MKTSPSIDKWLEEAKRDENAAKCGMYLVHNGVVRETARKAVRENAEGTLPVTAMEFSYDENLVRRAEENALALPGIFYVRTWLNEGLLRPGDDIMYVLVGGDIRPHVVDALQSLVGELKNNCVSEKELY